MADGNGTGGGNWAHGANAIAAVVTASVAAIGLGVALWHGGKSDEKPAAPPTSAAIPAPPATPRAPSARAVAIEPVSASLGFAGDADSDGSRPVQAILTVRIRNDGAAPVRIGWLDGRRNAALALSDGTRLDPSRDTGFSGFPDCPHNKAKECGDSDTVTLVPTDDQLATVTFNATLPAEAVKRIGTATTATFTGRLAVRPASGDAYASPVSLEKVPVSNGAR